VTAQGANPTGALTIGPYSALILSQLPYPQLTVSRAGGVTTVAWPTAFSGWVLEAAPSPATNPPAWVQLPAAQYSTNSSAVFIHVTASAGDGFYRLRSP
jgi:hypothetical protein